MYEPEIETRARDYYDLLDVEVAIRVAKERIEEWSYEDDPHGYCHTRPVLVRLVQAAERAR